MTKTQAIKQARSEVSQLYRFGDGFKYSAYDPTRNSWVESEAFPYWKAMAHRCEGLVIRAVAAMYGDVSKGLDAGYDYSNNSRGLSWTDFVE